MAINLREGAEILNSCLERDRTNTSKEMKTEPKVVVPVIYYLSRHGQLEQPHFMEVPLSSRRGLFLRDVIKKLDTHRGEGFARMYSWSSKRGYKNGYVWQDLSENDLINPSQRHEYILKGSLLLLETCSSFRSYGTPSSYSESKNSSESNTSSTESNLQASIERRNQSWKPVGDLCQDIIYKAKTSGEIGTNAATQTDERRRRGTDSEAAEPEECGRETYSNSSFGRLENSRSSIDGNGVTDLKDQTIGKSQRWNGSKVLLQFIKCTF